MRELFLKKESKDAPVTLTSCLIMFDQRFARLTYKAHVQNKDGGTESLEIADKMITGDDFARNHKEIGQILQLCLEIGENA